MQTPRGEYAALFVPERHVAPPASLSERARAFLAAAARAPAPMPYPAPDDHDGWRAFAARLDALAVNAELDDSVTTRSIRLNGVAAFLIEPVAANANSHVIVDLHGGAFVFGGGAICRDKGIAAALAYGATTYAIDYRTPPDHPYPAALDDCVDAYGALVERYPAQRIVVQGTSAGGNLAAALMLRLHEAGAALPAGVVLRTPEVDLTESGDTFATNLGLDTMLRQSLRPANLLYADGRDLSDPFLSPIFGTFGPWHPPVVLTTGTRDLLLSDTVRMHRRLRRAGVEADLIVEEAAPHGGIPNSPENDETLRELCVAAKRFADRCGTSK